MSGSYVKLTRTPLTPLELTVALAFANDSAAESTMRFTVRGFDGTPVELVVSNEDWNALLNAARRELCRG